ncbi:MAG: hypothetical protein LQ337_001327, partial [Flavoplaca oasis]
MDWFIRKVRQIHGSVSHVACFNAKQGEIVEEDKPKRLQYSQLCLAGDAPPTEVETSIDVCADTNNKGPSVYKD